MIGYYSHRNTGAETRYKVYDLESLALVKAVHHFRHFTVQTDHSALTNLRNKPIRVARQLNWLESLNDFSFDITYIKGETFIADFLSRNQPTPDQYELSLIDSNGQITKISTTAAATQTKHTEVMNPKYNRVKLQRESLYKVFQDISIDPLIDAHINEASHLPDKLHVLLRNAYSTYPPFIKTMEEMSKDESNVDKPSGLSIINGVLFDKTNRILIPYDSFDIIIPLVKLFHLPIGSGHGGPLVVHTNLAKTFYWPEKCYHLLGRSLLNA